MNPIKEEEKLARKNCPICHRKRNAKYLPQWVYDRKLLVAIQGILLVYHKFSKQKIEAGYRLTFIDCRWEKRNSET